MRRLFLFILTVSIIFTLAACGNQEEMVAKNEYDEIASQNETLAAQVASLSTELQKIKEETLIPQLKEEAAAVVAAIGDIGEVTIASEAAIDAIQAQYDALREDAKQYVTNADMLEKAKTRVAELLASQSDADKAQEYKSSCLAGYDYTELSRDPDTYVGNKAKFTGQVVQVIEDAGTTAFRVAVTKRQYGIWTDVIYVKYTMKTGEKRILNDDIITVYGEMQPLLSYQTVRGDTLSIPAIDAKYIDR